MGEGGGWEAVKLGVQGGGKAITRSRVGVGRGREGEGVGEGAAWQQGAVGMVGQAANKGNPHSRTLKAWWQCRNKGTNNAWEPNPQLNL